MVIQTQAYGRHFLEYEQKPVTALRQPTLLVTSYLKKKKALGRNQNFQQVDIHNYELDSFSILKGFLIRLVVALTDGDF